MLTGLRLDPRARRWLSAAALAAMALQVAVIKHRAGHGGDYAISREFGRRFLAGEYLYRGGLHFPYPPSAAMYFSPLALVDPAAGIVLRYVVAVACLWLTLKMLYAMVRGEIAAAPSREFTIGALTVVLASHYLIRDLDDGGPHLILLAILMGGIYSAWRARRGLAAICFGLAIALKVTPAVLVPFFAWKRQWRLAGLTLLAAACWMALPMARMGPADWWRHQSDWIRSAGGFLAGSNPAAEFYYGAQHAENQALKPALTHLLGALAAGARGAEPGAAPCAAGAGIATAAGTVLVALFCWTARRRYRSSDDPAWLLECSAVLILSLLLSPITWVQHLVVMIPALYLVAAEEIGIRSLGTPSASAMGAFAVLALVLNRELLGKHNYGILLDYHIHTLSMLLVLGVLMIRRPTAPAGER